MGRAQYEFLKEFVMTGSTAYRRSDGVAVILVALLGLGLAKALTKKEMNP